MTTRTMRIAVVGAAGRTGSHLVRQAAAAGHHVTALARTAARVPETPGTRVVEGDLGDASVVDALVRDQDAVVCAIAAPGRDRSTAVSVAVTSLVAAMERTGPRRLVLTSSRNLVATRPRAVVVPVRWAMRHVYADLLVAEEVVRASSLDWTIARATRLSEADARGSVWTDQEVDATGGDWKLPRADLAAALLCFVQHDAYVRQVVGVNGAAR